MFTKTMTGLRRLSSLPPPARRARREFEAARGRPAPSTFAASLRGPARRSRIPATRLRRLRERQIRRIGSGSSGPGLPRSRRVVHRRR